MTWFRGAAETIALDTQLKSVVIYGENGSGKSSFVDSVEYLLNGGKVGHLAHEYSGKHQEKGLLNTATPDNAEAQLRVVLADGSEGIVRIKPDGTAKFSGAGIVTLAQWAYHRTVLRQDEIAEFIRDTKGDKYSALLPLLGLQPLEVAAENLRQLAKAIEENAGIREAKENLRRVNAKRAILFKDADDTAVLDTINQLYAKYCSDQSAGEVPEILCVRLETALAEKVRVSSAEQRRHLALQTVGQVALAANVKDVRGATLELAASVEPLVAEKLEVLGAAQGFARGILSDGDIKCPACGRSIPASSFVKHVEREKARLGEVATIFDRRIAQISTLCQSMATIKAEVAKPELKAWGEEAANVSLGEALEYLETLDIEVVRRKCDEEALRAIERHLLPLIDAAEAAAATAPAEIHELASAKAIVEFSLDFLRVRGAVATASRAAALIAFLGTLEEGVRQEIRSQSKAVIDDISADMQGMWGILHPGSQIQDVKLYYPDDVDKAIDVQLTFYGVLQPSPRLTLSEGYRNSLGLCIFLAMAKREASTDRPLVLDDVVVSLDRNHRGMIRELLEKEFSERQVILLTHDREWYTELRQQLDDGKWLFKTLWPYDLPQTGIRWSSRNSTFDDARALLESAPDAAGNTARKIMDIELALLAERLRSRMPYLHGYKNDHRTGHDFIARLIADAPSCFKKMGEKAHEPYAEGVEALKAAEKLLVSWGNKASHTFDVVKKEAEKLITTCEEALGFFFCGDCKKSVYRLDDTSGEFVQCQCGKLRWRYGKA